MGALAGLMLVAFPALVIGIWEHRRQKRVSDAAAPQNPAFELDISMKKLRTDPELLDAIRGKAAVVVAGSAPVFTNSRYGGGVHPNFTSFLIDTNGEAHDLESHPNAQTVEQNAQWLSWELCIPFENNIC